MHVWLWLGFLAVVLTLLAIDLFVVNRKDQAISVRKAIVATLCFASLGALFSVVVYAIYQHDVMGYGTRFVESARAAAAEQAHVPPPQFDHWQPPADSQAAKIAAAPGKTAATLYLTGWLVEYALSMDNIFVMALIFAHFRIPAKFQHRVLFWGIMGALILRGIMIGVGAAVVSQFHYVLYAFGLVLIYTAIKMLRGGEDEFDPEKSWIFRTVSKIFPFTSRFDGHKFFTIENARRVATPLFLVLLIVEGTDVVFAVDSIPAIFSITQEPFIVFTSNVFAILGLRSLYFALAGAMHNFQYLKHALAFVLAFVGVKMLLPGWQELAQLANARLGWNLPAPELHIAPHWSLAIIAGALALGVIASLLLKQTPAPIKDSGPGGDDANPAH